MLLSNTPHGVGGLQRQQEKHEKKQKEEKPFTHDQRRLEEEKFGNLVQERRKSAERDHRHNWTRAYL